MDVTIFGLDIIVRKRNKFQKELLDVASGYINSGRFTIWKIALIVALRDKEDISLDEARERIMRIFVIDNNDKYEKPEIREGVKSD